MSFQNLLDQFNSQMDRFLQFTVDVIYDRKRKKFFHVRLYAAFLRFLSLFYSFAVQCRYYLYNKRLLRDQPLGCLVVVVGNLTVGGTGKTPIVEKFARSLKEKGRTVAILSRGYKSKNPPAYKRFWAWLTHRDPLPPRIVSDGKSVLLNSEEAGDEPFMLAKNLPGIVVLVDKNRVKAGHYAITKFGADTLILDDGFQYLPLRGRLNILLVDKTNPFGNGELLPRGILREPIKHLKRASYVFLTKSDGTPTPQIEATIREHLPNIEIIECAHRPKFLVQVGQTIVEPIEFLHNKKVALFSGIAVPESFEKLIRDLGALIVYNHRFLDHHRFTDAEINEVFTSSLEHKVDCVITTEKDAVRLSADFEPPVPLYYLRMEIELLSGAQDFEKAVSRICFPKHTIKATRAFPRIN